MDDSKVFKDFKSLLDNKKFSELQTNTELYLKSNDNKLFALEFLGIAHFSLKKFDKALEVFEKILKINSYSVPALLHLARISCINKDYKTASNLYDKLIKLDKNDYFLLIEYGYFLIDLQQYNTAIPLLREAININKNLFQAHSLMGNIFLKTEKFVNAVTYLIKSIELNPRNAVDCSNIGFCYYKLENIKKAKDFFLKSIDINPQFSKAYSNLGLVYQTEGNFIEAITCYEKCLEINPNDYEAFRLLSTTKKINIDDKHVQKMKSIMNSEITDHDRMLISFSLAKVMEDNKKYDAAALYLNTGNFIRRSSFKNFSIDQIEKQFELLIKTFSLDFFNKNKFNHDHQITPIFILGLPRSGTTLVEQILSNHNKVYGCGEINDLTDSINQVFPDGDSLRMLNNVMNANHEAFREIGKIYISKLKKYSNDIFFTDKMPFNFKVIGLIKICIPNAKIIHCYRNCNDNLLSIYKNLFSNNVMPWAYDKNELKIYYKCYQKLMSHYNSMLGNFIYNLEYETLTQSSKKEIEKLLNFCDLEWSDACLNIEENNRPIFTASISQVREKINISSHKIWKNFEKFLPDLFLHE